MFVYRTYLLEGEADVKSSLGDIWNFFEVGSLPKNARTFSRQIINCMRGWSYIQKIISSPLNIETIKQTHKIMMDKEKHRDGKDVLVGNIESRLYLHAIIFLHQLALLEDIWKVHFLDFMKLKRMIQLWPMQICLEKLSIHIHMKMETEEFVA